MRFGNNEAPDDVVRVLREWIGADAPTPSPSPQGGGGLMEH